MRKLRENLPNRVYHLISRNFGDRPRQSPENIGFRGVCPPISGAKNPINVDLERLDSELLFISETWHRDVGAAVYSRWLPYRYVAAWRKGSAFLPMMAVVCRLYSKIVMGFRS